MDKTPFRVRGKRRKTDMDCADARPESFKKSKSGTRKIPSAAKKRSRTLSVLESLPAEILTLILFESMNVSLPLASHIIGAKLSSGYVYFEYTLRAVFLRDRASSITSLGSSPSPHTRLLRCKFFDFSFFQSTLKRLLQFGHHEVKQRKLAIPGYFDPWRKNVPIFFDNPSLLTPQTPRSIFDKNTWLPVKVLRGPWSREKASLLRLLAWAGAEVDWSHSSAGQIATRGLLDAIPAGCELAVCTILEACRVKPTTEMYIMALHRYPDDPKTLFHLFFWDMYRDKSIDYRSPKIWDPKVLRELGEEKLETHKKLMDWRDSSRTPELSLLGGKAYWQIKYRHWPIFIRTLETSGFTNDLIPPIFARTRHYKSARDLM